VRTSRTTSRTTTTVIVGAGQAGLAMSRCLTERSIDHVILERGEIADSWRHERWDSLRLLSPNWQSRLPGYRYEGDDPDGYMTMPEIVGYLSGYAAAAAAPVQTNTTVTSVAISHDEGYVVTTNNGQWKARTVVLASGAYNLANVPALADRLPRGTASVTPLQYRNPAQLDEGDVLVVGASASGIQLALEIQASGRQVTLAVGGHVRMPRVYRGMDIMWWLDAAGVLAERYDQVDDIVRARKLPTFQLVGSPSRATVDLNDLQRRGVKVVGRLAGITSDGCAQFSGSLRNQCELADLKMNRLLDSIDAWAVRNGLDDETERPHRFGPTSVEASPTLSVDLNAGVRTVLWATGYRPDYSWLDLPIVDRRGRICHDGGVTDSPGVYLLGARFLRRRKSTFIDGVGDDARDLSAHMAGYLDQLAARR
jgi:putative flavoprotein involved in K+ transport